MKIFFSIVSFLFIQSYIYSQNQNISNVSYFDGEPFLVIDPSNSQHLVAAWMGFQIGNKITIKTSYSNNGGVSWSTPIWQPHQITGNGSADVSMGYDLNSNLYMSYIDFDDVNFSNGAIYVRKSIDGGATWGSAVEATSINDCPNQVCIDRPWIAVDKSGGINDGVIYVTSMNANQPTLAFPPYHPYLSVSTDNGMSFSNPRYLDTLNFYSGSIIKQPMPSPIVTSNGVFMAIYPSYEPVNQGPFAHLHIAKSTSAGENIDQLDAYSGVGTTISNSYLKKGSVLKSDPSDPNHIAYFFLKETSGDADIYFMESFDAGNSWFSQERINQDPIGNGKLQDLVWADFDVDGDLAVCWRDRRNGIGNTYQETTEIYCAIRWKDSINFSPDFAISDTQVAHDVILEGKGNDFMNVNFLNDTIYVVWGDVRTGVLSIYMNKIGVNNGSNSIHLISEEALPYFTIYPNPTTDKIYINENQTNDSYKITNEIGQQIISGEQFPEAGISVSKFKNGVYYIYIYCGKQIKVSTFIKE